MKVKLGEAITVQPDKRMHDHVMDVAMGDVIDALVELITNADDSYGRLHRAGKRAPQRGKILIERFEQRKGDASYLVVRDHAEGMTLERMIEVLRSPGALSSLAGDRGYMGRGAKDCARFGEMIFESIREDRYARCRLTKRATQLIPEDNRTADKAVRERLGIPHGNGTLVKLEVGEEFKVPQVRTLRDELSAHYALQDIVAEHSDGELLIRNGLRPDEKPERVVARRPACVSVYERLRYEVPGYAGVEAFLTICRVDELFEERPLRSRPYGFLIAGRRAIHERSLLDPEIERDPNSRRYLGRIESDHLDTLLRSYEERRRCGQAHPADNPRLLVDPGRRFGLEKDHPFTRALFEEPIRRVRELLAKDRKQAQSAQKEIANLETRARLDRLARAASRFLRQQVDQLEELGSDEAVDDDSFVRNGILIYPTFLNVEVNQERELRVYVNRALLGSADNDVVVTIDKDALEVLGSPLTLQPHKARESQLVGKFRVRGRSLARDVCITAQCDGLPTVEALAQVIERKVEDRVFDEPLEFEYDEYRVRCGSQKTLRVFGKVPDIIRTETMIGLISSDPTTVSVGQRCVLRPVPRTNYALGEVAVQGKRLKAKAAVRASLNGHLASTEVKVIERPEVARGPTIRIELRDEDFG